MNDHQPPEDMKDASVPVPPGYEKAFQRVTAANHVPGGFYSDPAILEREKELIFKQDWLCLARAEMMPNTGDYQTFRILGKPVLIVRDEKGDLRAYVNMCLHRGVEIAAGNGTAQEFTCPYHAWLYNLDGQLMGASYMRDAENFKARDCKLPELSLGIWQGWVFVSLAKQPRPFEDYIRVFDEKFGYLNTGELKEGLRFSVELDCNWKFMVENFADFYHTNVVHGDTVGRFMSTIDLPAELREDGQMFVNEYDTGSLTETGKSAGVRLKALEGKSLRFSAMGLMPPNINFFVRPDYVTMYTSWPLGPDRMRLEHVTLWREETHAQENFAQIVEDFKSRVMVVVQEDVDMVESLQNAMRADDFFIPGRMCRLEGPIQNYVQYLVQRVFAEDAKA